MVSPWHIAPVFALALSVGSGYSQPPATDEIVIKLKLFDSNKPKTELIPKNVIVFLRNPADNQPQLLPNRTVDPVPQEAGFYRVRLPKDRLIEEMTFQVDSASGTNFNPAVVTKVVTAADMTIYPGASDPGERFAFQAYIGQLDTYRTIFNNLISTFGEKQGDAIRTQLKAAFQVQLQKMADAEKDGRLTGFTDDQLKTAREKVKSVLILYGLLPEEKADVLPAAATIIYVPIYPCYCLPRTYYPPLTGCFFRHGRH